MMDLMDRGLVERCRVELEENRTVFDWLMSAAFKSIRRAKENHDSLERYYIPHMDFNALDELYKDILKRLIH